MKNQIRAKRIQDPAHREKILAMKCIACRLAGVEQTTRTEGHHIKRRPDGTNYGSVKASDHEMIPLCNEHHWNGVGSKVTRDQFETEFGYERDLLEIIMIEVGLGVYMVTP